MVARIKAADADIGANAEMEYKIVDGDGLGIFKISVDKDTQEGIITIQKVIFPLFFIFYALMEECIRQNEWPYRTVVMLTLGRKLCVYF